MHIRILYSGNSALSWFSRCSHGYPQANVRLPEKWLPGCNPDGLSGNDTALETALSSSCISLSFPSAYSASQKIFKIFQSHHPTYLPGNERRLTGSHTHLAWDMSVAIHSRLLPDHNLVVAHEAVRWNLEVERSGTLTDAAGRVVVRPVARAKPATVITCVADGHAT